MINNLSRLANSTLNSIIINGPFTFEYIFPALKRYEKFRNPPKEVKITGVKLSCEAQLVMQFLDFFSEVTLLNCELNEKRAIDPEGSRMKILRFKKVTENNPI